MSEEKEGKVKLSIEIEISESLMQLMKEFSSTIPEMIAQSRKKKEE